jgi:hypothetical protein
VNSGRPIPEDQMLHIAGVVVMEKILDGELEVRGRLPGKIDYEPIPAAHLAIIGTSFPK